MSKQTIDISPVSQRIETMINFYEALNDVGKAGFILSIREEDQKPFLKAYEEYYNKRGTSHATPV